MCLLPLPVGGRGEHFGIRTSRKKGSKGVGGRRARKGHAFGGGVILKGKPEGVRRSLGKTEGREKDVRQRV